MIPTRGITAARSALYPGGSIWSSEWLSLKIEVHLRAGRKCQDCGLSDSHLNMGGWTADGVRLDVLPRDQQPCGFTGHIKYGATALCSNHLFGGDGSRTELLVLDKLSFTCVFCDWDPRNRNLDNIRYVCDRCYWKRYEALKASGVIKRFNAALKQSETSP